MAIYCPQHVAIEWAALFFVVCDHTDIPMPGRWASISLEDAQRKRAAHAAAEAELARTSGSSQGDLGKLVHNLLDWESGVFDEESTRQPPGPALRGGLIT
jgi:hypothetical protein